MSLQPISLDSPIKPRPPGHPIPLTSSQARLWKNARKADGTRPSLRLCASAVRIVGPLRLELLESSLAALVQRHEALRTRIVVRDGRPYQHIDPAALHVLTIINLADQSADPRREVSSLVQEFIDTRIDLAVGPLFEAKIWRLSDAEHVLILLIDHIVSDGMSNGIVTRELWELYRQRLLGQSVPVDPPRTAVQFADYAVWQSQTHAAWMDRHAEYWRGHLRGAVRTVIPTDQASANAGAADGATASMTFGEELTRALREAARRERVLLSVLVLTAYVVVLSAWCRTEDLLVIFPSHGRHQPALHGVVGLIANMLHLRIRVGRGQTFGELLAQVKREVAAALEHRDFDRVPDLLPECRTEVAFNWQSTHSKQGALDHHVVLECGEVLSRSIEPGSSTDQLTVMPFPARSAGVTKFGPVIFDTPAAIHMVVSFDPTVLAPSTIDRFGRNLLTVCNEVCQSAAPRIESLLQKIAVD